MKPLSIINITKVLAYTALLLFALGLIAQFLEFLPAHNPLWTEVQESYIRLFRLDGEANIPTWFSSALLTLSALLMATIGSAHRQARRPYAKHWTGLALVFVYLSIDETAVLHEMSMAPLRAEFGTSGLLYYPWVIPALLALAVLGVIYTKFLLYLPARTRWLIVTAAAVFVGGAVGMEVIGGLFLGANGVDTPVSMIFEAVEELLEMSGVVVLIYALMTHLRDHEEPIRILFR